MRLERHASLNEKIERGNSVSRKEKKEFEPFSVKLITEDDREYSFGVPWNGYFERLEDVYIETVYKK